MTLNELFQAELDKLGPGYAQFYHPSVMSNVKRWFAKGMVAERKECAKIADDYAKGQDMLAKAGNPAVAPVCETAADVGHIIADEIRCREEEA